MFNLDLESDTIMFPIPNNLQLACKRIRRLEFLLTKNGLFDTVYLNTRVGGFRNRKKTG